MTTQKLLVLALAFVLAALGLYVATFETVVGIGIIAFAAVMLVGGILEVSILGRQSSNTRRM